MADHDRRTAEQTKQEITHLNRVAQSRELAGDSEGADLFHGFVNQKLNYLDRLAGGSAPNRS